VNLTFVQCEFHTGKTVIARIKSISELRCRPGFSRNIWFLFPISKGGKCSFFYPADAHAITDYFISGSTNKASSSNETKKRF